MSDHSAIEWTDATWGPVVGCTKVSAGCDNCYAERFVNRFAGTRPAFPHRFDVVTLRPQFLDLPLRWRKPRRIFVNSLADLFHDDVPDGYIARVWEIMAATPQHTYQILTKRHARMRTLLRSDDFLDIFELGGAEYPLPNVWLGVSIEDQRWADIRIPALLDTPAAVRWVSAEPLLGPVNLYRWLGRWPGPADTLDWVVAGGESGPGARPAHPDWFRSLREQCALSGVPFLFKQWGEWQDGSIRPGQRGVNHIIVPDGRHELAVEHQAYPDGPLTALARDRMSNCMGRGRAVFVSRVGKKAAGRELDGRTWDEYPQAMPA